GGRARKIRHISSIGRPQRLRAYFCADTRSWSPVGRVGVVYGEGEHRLALPGFGADGVEDDLGDGGITLPISVAAHRIYFFEAFLNALARNLSRALHAFALGAGEGAGNRGDFISSR